MPSSALQNYTNIRLVVFISLVFMLISRYKSMHNVRKSTGKKMKIQSISSHQIKIKLFHNFFLPRITVQYTRSNSKTLKPCEIFLKIFAHLAKFSVILKVTCSNMLLPLLFLNSFRQISPNRSLIFKNAPLTPHLGKSLQKIQRQV